MQKYATANNLKIRKSGKGITKIKLLQAILKNMKNISNNKQKTTNKNKTQVVQTQKQKQGKKKQNKKKNNVSLHATPAAISYEELRAQECNSFAGGSQIFLLCVFNMFLNLFCFFFFMF